MACNKIITIGRQFGSGGREVGQKLAEKLGIPFYDKELLKIAARDSGICEELFENFDEKPTNSFLYTLVMDPYSVGFGTSGELPLNHKVFLAAFDTIKSIAEKDGSCVFVGRCADYALTDYFEERKHIEPVSGHENALFLSSQRKRMSVRSVEMLVKKYSEGVIPMKHITPHKLRSTYGTELYRETGDIYLVADVLGHSDVNTTRKHYADMDEDRRRSARNRVQLREKRDN